MPLNLLQEVHEFSEARLLRRYQSEYFPDGRPTARVYGELQRRLKNLYEHVLRSRALQRLKIFSGAL